MLTGAGSPLAHRSPKPLFTMKKYLFAVVALALGAAPAGATPGHPVTEKYLAAHSVMLPGVEIDAVGPHHPKAARHQAQRPVRKGKEKTHQ
jgi:hypothetical protein